MIRIAIENDSIPAPLPFYLAIEEWVARRLPAGSYFFTWRVAPSVICGRNQDIPIEVDLDYCRQQGISVWRRKSGGGSVYADMDNLMISCITPSDNVEQAFAEYTRRLADALRSLGLDAEPTSRNDITVAGRKLSGNAFYHLPDRAIAHGTLLHSTNLAHMTRALTPARAKLESKKVTSVASRITTVSEHLPSLSFDAMRHAIESSLSDSAYALTAADLEQIHAIEREYYAPGWILPAPRHAGALQCSRRIDGAGCITLSLQLHQGLIAGIDLSGDYFALRDTAPLLARAIGKAPTPQALAKAYEGADASAYVHGLGTQALIALIADAAAPENIQS